MKMKNLNETAHSVVCVHFVDKKPKENLHPTVFRPLDQQRKDIRSLKGLSEHKVPYLNYS